MHKKTLLGLLTLITLFISSLCVAAVYKWTDANGNIHYGQQPGNPNASSVNIDATPQKNEALNMRNQSLKNKQVERNQKQSEDAKTRAQAAADTAYQQQVDNACKQYYENLAILNERGQRVYTVKPDGETQYFSDEDRDKQIAATQKLIDQHCKES